MMVSEIAIILVLLTPIGLTGRGVARVFDTGGEPPLSTQLTQNSTSVRPSEAQQSLHTKCVDAGERAERQAAEMVPGRTWTWALDAERSLQQLNELRLGLTALRECENAFEGSLTSDQISKYQTQIRVLKELSQHLERDVQSLDDELRKGHPRRWHVANDATDMRNEIRRRRELNKQMARAKSQLTE